MILDTSVLAAIFFEEPEEERFTALIQAADRCLISAGNFVELSDCSGSRDWAAPRSTNAKRSFGQVGMVIEPVHL